MVDAAADALELAGDDVLDDVAGDVDRVGAQAADDAVGDAEGRGLDEELVVALEAVDLDDLDRGVADVEPGAEDALGGDHEVVGELGAEHDELVEAGAAVDRDRRVDVVGDLVLAAAGADVERPGGGEAEADDRARDAVGVERDRVVRASRRLRRVASAALQTPSPLLSLRSVRAVSRSVAERARVVGVGAGDRVERAGDVGDVAVGVAVRVRVADGRQGEGPDDEQVVVVVALEPQLGLVGVDGELVVAGAAGGDQRGADARAQPAAGGRDERRERVVRQATPPVEPTLRLVPKIWPIWKMSSPAPPSRVVIALVSSTKN